MAKIKGKKIRELLKGVPLQSSEYGFIDPKYYPGNRGIEIMQEYYRRRADVPEVQTPYIPYKQTVPKGSPTGGYTSIGSSDFVPETPEWIKPLILDVARRYGLPPLLISAQLSNESIQFNPDVVYGRGKWAGGNVAGAAGVAQFIPSTARAYGLRVDNQIDERLDPEKTLEAYGKYMTELLKRYGTVERALSAYNSGNPDRYLVSGYRTWYGSVDETKNYVKNIIGRSGIGGKLQTGIIKDQYKNVTLPSSTGESIKNFFRKSGEFLESSTSVPSAALRAISKLSTPAYAAEQMKTKPVQKDIFGQLEPYRNLLGFEQRKQEMIGPLDKRLFEAAANKPKTYSVQPGDTLWEISRRLLGDPFRWRELGFQGDQRKLPVGYQIPISQSLSGGGGGGGSAPAPSAAFTPQIMPQYKAPTPQAIMRAIQNPPQYTRPTQQIPLNLSLGPTSGSSAQRRRSSGASASW